MSSGVSNGKIQSSTALTLRDTGRCIPARLTPLMVLAPWEGRVNVRECMERRGSIWEKEMGVWREGSEGE